MVRHPQANRSALGVLQALGNAPGCRQNERVGTGRHRLDEPIGPVVDPRVVADLGEVTTHQREIVPPVRLSNLVDTVRGLAITDVASEGVARVRGIGHQAALANGIHELAYPARLRVPGVYFDQLGHARIVDGKTCMIAPLMQLFIDYLPILVFVGAYFYKGKDFFFATAALMIVMPIVMAVQWLMTRKLNKIYAASTALVLVFGSATLLFRNQLFLYWKPTVLNWAIALVFLGSQFIGTKTIVERMLGGAATLQPGQWRRLNQIWAGFFLVVGAINLWVAYTFSEPTWVKFKFLGMLGLTLAFVIVQTIWLTMVIKKNETPGEGTENVTND